MSVGMVVGRRVVVRVFREEDVPAIDVWYEEAVQAAGIPQPRPLSPARERGGWESGVLVIERVGEPEPIGVVEYSVRDGWLAVGFIGLAKAYRGWGYGSETVRLLEESASRSGQANRFRAEVDRRNGLGLYFWLRMGYRPEAGSGGAQPMVREPR